MSSATTERAGVHETLSSAGAATMPQLLGPAVNDPFLRNMNRFLTFPQQDEVLRLPKSPTITPPSAAATLPPEGSQESGLSPPSLSCSAAMLDEQATLQQRWARFLHEWHHVRAVPCGPAIAGAIHFGGHVTVATRGADKSAVSVRGAGSPPSPFQDEAERMAKLECIQRRACAQRLVRWARYWLALRHSQACCACAAGKSAMRLCVQTALVLRSRADAAAARRWLTRVGIARSLQILKKERMLAEKAHCP